MRICQLSHVETAFNFVSPLFTALAADGHEVVAACNLDHDGAVLRRYLGEGVEFHRIKVSRKITAQAFTSEIADLARYLARERFDVLHLHGPLAALQGRLAARLAGVPVVISHAHGFYFHERMSPLTRTAHVSLERFFGRHLTDYIVTVNEEDLRFARNRGFTVDPSHVIGTPGVGIDTRRFRPLGADAGRAVRRELGVPDDELVVTFVGRLVAEKGLLELAAAFSGLLADRPAWLWLAGGLSPTERDQAALHRLEEIQSEHPEAARRTLRLGQRNDIPEVLAATDVFVLPSHREGMPVSLMEAMACEVPAVTTDIRGCREAVAYGEAGVLVPAGESEALTEALRKVAADPDERRRLGEAGRAAVEERYAVEHAIAPLLALYRRIHADASGVRPTGRARLFRAARRLVPLAVRSKLAAPAPWRIAVQHVAHPLDHEAGRTDLVFSDAAMGELGLQMVADPFAVHRDDRWHLFFEQVAAGARRGEIALATSTDLRSWIYHGPVLAEPFHLSYPHVIESGDETFMIPESAESGQIRLYRAARFPDRWELCAILAEGLPYKDSSLFERAGRWYLLTETSRQHTYDELRLFSSADIRGPWREHPASPLVTRNSDSARCGGRIVDVDGRPLRFSQRCSRHYGESVLGHAIDLISATEYRESTLPEEILRPRPGAWNAKSVHHLDAHRVADGWVRFVDGHR
ncbi:glycosyltransferase [Pseudonocardia sp. DSM 110487]|uniref:glucosamine inositolphosphorylceramide transferase family protein n=1 Tax=Pseudonocardia sp. DSM 110487 TaxID=2865833 RepID=UPI001C6A796D|nr:glycosyltransferase [Pseudonocardia sp. DSM 110487]QYN34505.1 glycosyltransferase [Pseudonocardia sp. DSM 110487]